MSPDIRQRARRRQRARWLRYNILYPITSLLGQVAFPFRHPVLWWYCRRVDLHVYLGLPMPANPEARVRL